MKNLIFRIALIIMMVLFVSIENTYAQPQKSYTYGCYVDYNVTRGSETGLLAHINARVYGRKGHRIQIGMMFISMNDKKETNVVGGRNEILDATSDNQNFTDVQVFIPYEEYMLNSWGQYAVLDLDKGDAVYIDFDTDHIFLLDKDKVRMPQKQSANNKDVSIMRAEAFAMRENGKWSEWQKSDMVIVNDMANSKFVIQTKEPIELRLTREESQTTDNEGTTHFVAHAVDQKGNNIKVSVDVYTDGRMFITFDYGSFAAMYKLKTNK